MRIQVKLSTTLRDYVPGYDPVAGLYVDMDEGATPASLAKHMALPPDEIKILMVNGRQHNLENAEALRDGDRVAYFPAVGGG